MSDLISRADAIDAIDKLPTKDTPIKFYEVYRMAINDAEWTIDALPSADAVPQLRQTDTLIIADALRYLAQDTERHELDRTRAEELREQILQYGASMCKGGAE